MIDVEPLVTLAEAKLHLRATGTASAASDQDIQMKLNQAIGTILDLVGSTLYWRTIAATWTEQTVPAYVHAAMLLLLAELYAERGDGDASRTDTMARIERLLARSKDPVLA